VSAVYESWAKESFEIATKIAYRNGGRLGFQRIGLWIARCVRLQSMAPTGVAQRSGHCVTSLIFIRVGPIAPPSTWS
jgi:hypothetical protein